MKTLIRYLEITGGIFVGTLGVLLIRRAFDNPIDYWFVFGNLLAAGVFAVLAVVMIKSALE